MGTCSAAKPCSDFPATPVIDPSAPANAPTLFTGTAGPGGPCLAEPADGALFPKNWQRPRVLWVPAASSQTLFEVRIHSDAETNDYLAYTAKTNWTMDSATWSTIAAGGHLVGTPITVAVRATSTTGGTLTAGNVATFTIAPADAPGSVVYWSTASFDTTVNTATTLRSFSPGDEGTTIALTANQVQQEVRASPLDGGNFTPTFQQVYCIGCHTPTPDGTYVAFTAQWPWPNAMASIDPSNAGSMPPWLTSGAIQNLNPDYRGDSFTSIYGTPAVNQLMLGIETFSPSHYATGDRIVVSTLGAGWSASSVKDPGMASGVTSELAWFDLEWQSASTVVDAGLPMAPRCKNPTTIPTSYQPCLTPGPSNGGWGLIARNGDTNGAGAPSWSHNADGQTDVIAYVSTNVGVKDGRMDCSVSTSPCTADIYTVPYGSSGPGLGGVGGAATPLAGASDPAYNEYYPAFSPDDKLIAFNRVASGTSMYNQPKAEVFVIPYNGGKGGTAARISANDPVACTGAAPGGVQNTWPKWAQNPANGSSPQTDANGNAYYWLAFSSTRSPTAGTTFDPATGLSPKNQQLYVAAVVVSPSGTITTFAPVFPWNQDASVNNLVPAWR